MPENNNIIEQASAVAQHRDNQYEILQAVANHIGAIPECPLCHSNKWQIQDGYISMSVTSHPLQVRLGGQVLPCIAMICGKCGNTHLMNLRILKLDKLLT